MIFLKPPDLNAREVFETCVERTTPIELRERLQLEAGTVEKAANAYTQAAIHHRLSTLSDGKHVVRLVTDEEFRKVYSNRMRSKTAKGRVYYEELRSGAKNGRCPLCNVGEATTLDHHLPKSKYPVLSVVPVNLVPCCNSCNMKKGSRVASTPSEETFHPYFDNIGTIEWLKATVKKTTPPALKFYIAKNEHENRHEYERVLNHFSVYGLAKRFSSRAAGELTVLSGTLAGLLESGGLSSVREHLRVCMIGQRSVSLNSWETAAYKALLESDWYCSGGFDFN